MNTKTLVLTAICAFGIVSCTSIQQENQKVNDLANHGVRKGDSKSEVIRKIGKPLVMQEFNGTEMWIYTRSNESGLINPRVLIPVVGMVASMRAMDQSGGYQSVSLTINFNGQDRVSSVNVNKTSARLTKF
ncbi:hypothetical protein [Verrucomicrobium spinosum]|uniref:hypothetical protein n=1 Tax=Verrucomicrobium spinosum TaxID=2736 RepID=UPI000AD84A4D|nr:hypothetical protein [Verrucomicrobium spinosum]